MEVQVKIAEGLDIPLEEVYGVVTFYAQFSLYPKGQYKISVCLGTACYVKGSGDVYDRLQQKLGIKGGECTPDGKFSLDACRCVGACGLAPVMTVNDEVFGKLVPMTSIQSSQNSASSGNPPGKGDRHAGTFPKRLDIARTRSVQTPPSSPSQWKRTLRQGPSESRLPMTAAG